MVLKHVLIKEELHDIVLFYCFVKKVKITKFMNDIVENDKRIKEFRSKMETLKVLRC